MINHFFLILFVASVLIFPCYGQEQQGENDNEKNEGLEQSLETVNYENSDREKEVEETAEIYSEVEEFYKDPGFQLVPKSRVFSLNNVLRNEIYYESNVFLTENDVKGDAVYAVDYSVSAALTLGRFELSTSSGVRYECHFNQNYHKFDSTFPFLNLNLKYEGEVFYASLREHFYGSNVPNTLEYNDRSNWYQNDFGATAGFRYKRWIGEINTTHTYVDFRRIDSDYQTYGQSYLVGYRLSRRTYLTLEYGWDCFDYIENEPDQKDTWGHHALVGVRVQLARGLSGGASTGFQYRDSDFYWMMNLDLAWNVTPRLNVQLSASQRTYPSLFGDYRLGTSASLSLKYLITPRLAMSHTFTMTYSNPEQGNDSFGYQYNFSLTYRIYKGIDLEAFYKLNLRDSSQPAGDYQDHIIGASLNITF